MISVSKTETILFSLFIIGGYFLPAEICLMLSIIGIGLSTLRKPINKDLLKSITLPLLIVFLGLINAHKNSLFASIKDVYFYVFPIFIFGFGYVYAYYKDVKSIIELTIKLGVILSFLYLIQYDFNADYSSISQMKEEEGVASFIVVFALFLKIFEVKKIKTSISIQDYLTLLLLSFVCIITFSRTFIIVFVVLFVFGTGKLTLNKQFFRRMAIIIFVIIITVIMILNIKTTDRNTFIGKIRTSFKEMVISNYASKQDINSNWRGFEAFKGVQQILRGNTFEMIVGQGFGVMTPLGMEFQLGDATFSEIPKFHNGYINILLKTGVLGFLIYIYFFIRIMFVNLKDLRNFGWEYMLSKNLIAGISMTILLATLVISGWLNKGTFIGFVFFLGYFMNMKRLLFKVNV